MIRCIENALRAFGGVTATIVPDNLKAAVIQPDWFDPEINPKLRAFCAHYGTVTLPTKPGVPRHKGKVEAGVKYVQNNALRGRRFASLADQNAFLQDRKRNVADRRIHGTIRRQLGAFFAKAERPHLRPLPASLFPSFEEAPPRSTATASSPSPALTTRCHRSMSAARSGFGPSHDYCASITDALSPSPPMSAPS